MGLKRGRNNCYKLWSIILFNFVATLRVTVIVFVLGQSKSMSEVQVGAVSVGLFQHEKISSDMCVCYYH